MPSSVMATLNQLPVADTQTGPSSFLPHTEKSHCYLVRATGQTFCPVSWIEQADSEHLPSAESPWPSPTSMIINLPLAKKRVIQ